MVLNLCQQNALDLILQEHNAFITGEAEISEMEPCMENPCKTTPLQLPRKAKGFKVDAELKLAPGKGIGVFAAQFIPANTRVDDPCYIYFDEQESLEYLASLPNDEERKKFLEHSFGRNGKIALHDENLDDGGLVNHCDNPTMATSNQDGYTYTTRDVPKGEELTEDYATYEEVSFYEKLCEQYGVVDWFVNNEK